MPSGSRRLIALVLAFVTSLSTLVVYRAPNRRRHGSAPGAIIAFVGPDASGKTTLVNQLTELLTPDRDVQIAQFSWIPEGRASTSAIRTAILATRKVVRVLKGDRSYAGLAVRYPGFESMLDVCSALDVWLLSKRCQLARDTGAIVITDRYPSAEPGSANGPQPLRSAHPG